MFELETTVPSSVVDSDALLSEMGSLVDVKLAGAPLGDDSPVEDSSVMLSDVITYEELESDDEPPEEVSPAPPEVIVDEKL